MRRLSGIVEFVLIVVALAVFAAGEAVAEDWLYYGASAEKQDRGPFLMDWYVLNRMKLAPQSVATAYHYYDQDGLGYNSPFPGGIVRVWEKYVLQKETKTYEEAREEIEKGEEIKLKRKISVLDYAWVFPLAVNRATKEIETLLEINCDSKEFYILEVNNYDKTGHRLTRETNFDVNLWIPIQPETVMEALSTEICR